jgi:hypothetical protein
VPPDAARLAARPGRINEILLTLAGKQTRQTGQDVADGASGLIHEPPAKQIDGSADAAVPRHRTTAVRAPYWPVAAEGPRAPSLVVLRRRVPFREWSIAVPLTNRTWTSSTFTTLVIGQPLIQPMFLAVGFIATVRHSFFTSSRCSSCTRLCGCAASYSTIQDTSPTG